MAFLSLSHLTKSFAKLRVIDQLNLEVEAGECVVIFGASASGKTTLLRMIAGLITPDSGEIVINGRSVLDDPSERRDVAMAFQNFALYPHLSAFENIASPMRARKVDEAEVRRRVEEIASVLRIEHVLKHLPRQLSNGQKQRTCLARSMVHHPSVLLLDDPLRNVDARVRFEMRLELPRIFRRYGTTVIYITQDFKEAMALGHRVGALFDGKLMQIDSPAGIYCKPADVRVARLFGDPPINLVPCTRNANDPDCLTFAGQCLPARSIPDIQECIVGIRPEDIRLAKAEDVGSAGIDVLLETITPLNRRTVALLKTSDGGELLASFPENEGPEKWSWRGHQKIRAHLNPDRILFFDHASGLRLQTL